MTMLTELVMVGDRRIWARFSNRVTGSPLLDANELDAINPDHMIETADCDVRESVDIGEVIIDNHGNEWGVVGLLPPDVRFGGSLRLRVQRDIIVLL